MPLPRIVLDGRLTADPELRFTPSGAAVVNFTVVCADRRKNETTQEWEDKDTSFFHCSAWRQLAENIAESFRKGDHVLVTGKFKQRDWTDKEGGKRTSFEVDADNASAAVQFRVVSHSTGKASRGSTAAPTDDPWASPPADEPPF